MNDIKDKFLKLNKAREVFTEILFEIEESLEKRRNDIIRITSYNVCYTKLLRVP